MPANPPTVPGSAPADIELADLRQPRVRLAGTWKLRNYRSGCLMTCWIIATILSLVLWFVSAGTSVGVGCYQTNCTSIANATSMAFTYPVVSLYTAALTTTYPTTIPAITTFGTTTYVTTASETVASETVAAAFHREATWAAPANDTNHQLDAQSTSWQVAVQYFLILYYVISFFALCLVMFNRYKKQRNARDAAAPAWPGREERARERARQRELDNEVRNQELIDSLTEHGLLSR